MGPFVPDMIKDKIFKLFASRPNNDSSEKRPEDDKAYENVSSNNLGEMDINYIMTEEDFLAYYVAFKDLLATEVCQVAFEMIKISPHHHANQPPNVQQRMAPVQGQRGRAQDSNETFFKKEDLLYIARMLLQIPDKDVHNFYVASKYDHSLPVFKNEFLEIYQLVKDNPLFNWIPEIVHGFVQENMNIDKDDNRALTSRLTQLSEDRSKIDAEEEGLSAAEVESIKEFFDNDIKNRPATLVLKVFNKMFKDIKSQKFKKYLMQSVSQVKGLTFSFVADLVLIFCKQVEERDRLEFLFDVFSKQSDMMSKGPIKDFIEIFKLPQQVFKLATSLSKEQFLENLENEVVDYTALEQAKPMITAMTAIIPANDDDECAAILAAFNGNRNLESFIYETLPEEQEYYVIEKKFWDQWTVAMNFAIDDQYQMKKELKENIDNKALMEPMHEFRMKDLTYKEDFVLIPKYAHYPLSKWYASEKTITRQVIQYKKQRDGGEQQSMMSSQYSQKFMMSSQKFYNPVADAFEEELVHRVGQIVFELEIYPNLIYLTKVSDKGEKLYNKAVVNGKVDYNYLRRVVKTDSLPFKELQLSRKATLHQVLMIAATQYQQNIKRGRLIIEDNVISSTKLFVTLEEFGVQQGQLIYAEFANSSNEYPSDLLAEKNKKDSKGKGKTLPDGTYIDESGTVQAAGKTGGLHNLGNTCYMNSALQVIANLKIVHDYFVKNKQHLKQMNMKNPLGHKGELASAFGMLMERMWQQPGATIPRHFKMVVGRCNEQYSGNDQQDSQEYLSFLIDGLHEELNLRQTKPYIENPDSKDRDLLELSLEHWSNSLRRDWSLIYFLFYGQHRSSLQCRTCKTESTTFDIFSNVPLSLPEPTQQTLSIIVHRIPNRLKDILNNKIVKDDDGNVSLAGFQRLESNDSESEFSRQGTSHLRRMHSSQSNRDKKHLAQFTESYNYMTNDQPMHIQIKVDNEIKMKDVATKIAQIREVNIDPKQVLSEVILFQTLTNSDIRGIFNPEMKLSNYNLMGQDLFATEVLTRTGRDVVKKFYIDYPDFLKNHEEAVLKCVTYASEKHDQRPASAQNAKNLAVASMQSSHLQRPVTGESSYGSSQYTDARGRPVTKKNKFEIFNQITFGRNTYDIRPELPNDIIVVLYHRRWVHKKTSLFAKYQPQLISTPNIILLPKIPSGRRIYDEVWAAAHTFLRPTSKYNIPTHRWWELKNWKQFVTSGDGIYKPFVLKAVDRSGYACCLCHWTEKCSGCIIEPTDAPIFEENLHQKTFMAIEWHSSLLADNYNQTANEVVEHVSTKERGADDTQPVNYTTLDECLQKFHKTEQLENETTCEKCKTPQIHFKRMEVMRPPPVLVIQLKRFRQYGTQWRKLQTTVDFPIRNLDMSQFITDIDFVTNKLELETKYDLHGVVNHYGTLGFGHYVSFTRNPFDQKWYKYDDVNAEEVSEEKIQKESAYLLFYVRKDLERKVTSQIFPEIEASIFPGRPIKNLSGENGFIIEEFKDKKPLELSVKMKDANSKSIIKYTDLAPETDKNEIQYTPAELKEMNKLKGRRKSNFEQANQGGGFEFPEVQTRRCCGLLKAKPKRRSTMTFDSQRRSTMQKEKEKSKSQPPSGADVEKSSKVKQDLDQPVNADDVVSINSSISKPDFSKPGIDRASSVMNTPQKVVSARNNSASNQLLGNLSKLDKNKRPSQGDIGGDILNNLKSRQRFRTGAPDEESGMSRLSGSDDQESNNNRKVVTQSQLHPLRSEQRRHEGGRNNLAEQRQNATMTEQF